MRWRLARLLVMTLGTACLPAPLTYVTPPVPSGTLVLIEFSDIESPRATVLESGSDDFYSFPANERTTELYLLHYDAPPEGISLRPGPLTFAPTGTEPAFGLPRASGAFAGAIADDGVQWTAADQLPPEIEGLRIAGRPSICRNLSPRSLDLPGSDGMEAFAFFEVGDKLLVGTSTTINDITTGKLYEVDIDGNVRDLGVDPSLPVSDGFVRDDGEWVLAGANEVVIGTPESGFRSLGQFRGPRQASGALHPTFVQIDGTRSGPLDLYVLPRMGVVHRYSNGEWSTFENTTVGGKSYIAYRGPGEFVYTSRLTFSVFRYRDGRNTKYADFNWEGSEGPRALANVPGFGTTLGDALGQLYFLAEDGNRWNGLVTPIKRPIRGFAPFGSGLILTGGGLTTQYYGDFGFCPFESFARDAELTSAVDEGYALVPLDFRRDPPIEPVQIVLLSPN